MRNRLLLVEDEEHLAFTLELNLVEEGYAVDIAPDVASANHLLDQHSYDLFILDVMLPDGDGFELCRRIRASGVHAPVLMLTARGRSEDIVEGLESGADDYLTKPYSLRELLGRVSAMLRRRRWSQEDDIKQSPATFARFGTNTIDFSTHEALADGRRVELTELEVRLLRFFVENPDRVISRQELLETVWGLAASTNTRTVDNFLVRLRKTFEHDPSNPAHFVTVRGVGYRFVADPTPN